MPRAHHLPPQDLAEDEPTDDHPVEAQSSPPVPPAPSESDGPSMLAPPLQHISISPQDFLAIMDSVRTFVATSSSFATAQTALAERMTHIEAAVAQTTAMLAQNNAILMQIQSHLGLPSISPSVPAQASSAHPPTKPATSTHQIPLQLHLTCLQQQQQQ